MTSDELIRLWVSIHDRMGEFCEAHPEAHAFRSPEVRAGWVALCDEDAGWRSKVYQYLEASR